jgi:hypothetical protein
MRLRSAFFVFVALAAANAQETRLAADFRGEADRLTDSCSSFSFGALGSCAEVLFTDHPLHIAVGSLAPQNGVGFGLAMVGHWTPENWRNSWDVDAVASDNGSWRAGGYLTLVWIKRPKIGVTLGTATTGTTTTTSSGKKTAPAKSNLSVQEQLVFHVYAENTSLNKINFFGIGPGTSDTNREFFSQREAITGGNVVWPVWKKFNVALFGEANGRFVDIGNPYGFATAPEPVLSEKPPVLTQTNAPGLVGQPAFAQFGQGIRLRPTFINDYLRLNYSVSLQEYIAGNSTYSFRRFTTDLQHQIPLYKNTRTLLPQDFNGPDSCSQDVADTAHKCPPLMPPAPPGKTRNLEGSIGLRLLIQESIVPSGHEVPFYFQPTLGGSDINGFTALGSFQDYRFRAPNLMLFRANIEHSIYKWPIGVTAMIDEGKVGLNRSDIDFSHLQHSYSAGLTLRAGGFPMVYLLFSWGGHEGSRTSARIDTSLLGGSAHPSLF